MGNRLSGIIAVAGSVKLSVEEVRLGGVGMSGAPGLMFTRRHESVTNSGGPNVGTGKTPRGGISVSVVVGSSLILVSTCGDAGGLSLFVTTEGISGAFGRLIDDSDEVAFNI